tara:strand:- start:608 stop:1984 length:1377 start_codon:yes stop_codon:yes gene_type:complete
MKIAFVSYDQYQGEAPGIYPPIHLVALATTLQNHNYEVRVFDYAESFKSIDSYFKKISDFGPHVIGITCYTRYISSFNDITKKLRTFFPKAVMIAGGAHPSVWPEWTLENMPHFDYALQGECDNSILSFVEMLSGKISAEQVPGLVYRSNGSICKNKHDFIADLNILPIINREFLDIYYNSDMYWHLAANGKLDVMVTSRGCPYTCSFCFKLENTYRFRSVEHVMEEFEYLASRGIKSIHIQDDAFTANKKRALEIAKQLIKGRFNFELKIRSRVNSVEKEILTLLKKAGVKQIIYGIESGSQKMLDSMEKKTTVEMNRRAIALTKKAGIACYADMMIGMPGETRETIDETISFLKATRPIVGYIPVLYPLPRTKVYEDAKREGTLRGDWEVDGKMPWIELPWANSKSDIEAESTRISKTTQRDLGTLLYFLRHCLIRFNKRKVKFLLNYARNFLLTK